MVCHVAGSARSGVPATGGSAPAVHVGTVLDGDDGDRLTLVVDLVDHPVVATTCAMQALELEAKGLAHALGVIHWHRPPRANQPRGDQAIAANAMVNSSGGWTRPRRIT